MKSRHRSIEYRARRYLHKAARRIRRNVPDSYPRNDTRAARRNRAWVMSFFERAL